MLIIDLEIALLEMCLNSLMTDLLSELATWKMSSIKILHKPAKPQPKEETPQWN